MKRVKMDDNDKRDEQLIEEREEYEKIFFEHVIEDMIESDALDQLISDRLEYIDDNFDFEPSPEYEYLEELYIQQYDSMESAYNGMGFQEFISNDDDFDSFEEYDYPEGPDENLGGVRYDKLFQESNYEFEDYEPDYDKFIPDEEYEPEISDEEYASMYNQIIEDALIEHQNEEELYLKNLIEEHIAEEKYFDSLLIDTIETESFFERAIDELILSKIGIDYDESFFDYDNNDSYWYNDYQDQTDKSVIDPFDSFGEIDYPEEPSVSFEIPQENNYDEELQRDFAKYQRSEENELNIPYDEIPDPPEIIEEEDINELRNKELIENQEKIDSIFKDYFTKDDTLNNMIKEKLKEKKFNQ